MGSSLGFRLIRQAHLALWLCALIWGIGFIFQKMAMSYLPPLFFNTLRSTLAALSLFFVIFVTHTRNKSSETWISADELKVGAELGFWLSLALGCQQVGIVDTLTYRACFITGLYVILVPFVMRAMFSTTLASWQLSTAGLGCLGLFLLTTSANDFSISQGDLWVLLGAVLWAIHVSVLGQNKGRGRVLQIALAQMMCCALLSGLASILTGEQWDDRGVLLAAEPLLYAGVLSGGVAYTLQVYGQGAVSPSVSAIILSFEAVFGAWAGWYILQEPFSLRNLMGSVFIMLAIILLEITHYLQMIAKQRNQEQM